MVKLEANLFRGTKISGKYGNRYFKKGSSLIQRIKRQIYLSSREISNVKLLYFYYNFNFDKSIFRLDLNRTINVTFSMHNNQSSLSTVQAYKIHEYFSSFPFTFLSAPSDVLYIYIYSVIAKRRSCFHPFSLSLSLKCPPRIASLYRFVRNRDKSVLFDRRAKSHPTFIIIRIPSPRSDSRRFRETTDASSGRNKTGDPWHDATIWFMWPGTNVFDVSREMESKWMGRDVGEVWFRCYWSLSLFLFENEAIMESGIFRDFSLTFDVPKCTNRK